DVRGPELRPDVALPQAGNVRVQGLLVLRDVQVEEGQVLLNTVLPGQVVVPVYEDGVAVDLQRLVGQPDGLARPRRRLGRSGLVVPRDSRHGNGEERQQERRATRNAAEGK